MEPRRPTLGRGGSELDTATTAQWWVLSAPRSARVEVTCHAMSGQWGELPHRCGWQIRDGSASIPHPMVKHRARRVQARGPRALESRRAC